ncbi:hypothetical protein C3492_16830 [Streptomyces sp. Ru62]|nr:hypothetical protein C3492_16830 [Streptomyces sp. Ru62]
MRRAGRKQSTQALDWVFPAERFAWWGRPGAVRCAAPPELCEGCHGWARLPDGTAAPRHRGPASSGWNVSGDGLVQLGTVRPEAAELLAELITAGLQAELDGSESEKGVSPRQRETPAA